MAVTHLGTNSAFALADQTLTVPSGTAGDRLLAVGIGWPNPGQDPFIDGSAALLSAFPGDLGIVEGDSAGGDFSTVQVRQRLTDGTEPSTYQLSLDQGSNGYGASHSLVRLSACQLQATNGGLYGYAATGARNVPAHTVDTDGSMVVVCIAGYSSAPNNTAFTSRGYTSRVNHDGGWIRVYTKPVDAGAVASFSAGNETQSTAIFLMVFEPVEPGTAVSLYNGTSWVAADVSVYDGSAWQPADVTLQT